jgi:hypothetical protein
VTDDRPFYCRGARMTRAEYSRARQEARTRKGAGRILACPVRVAPGHPGVWVSSTGEVQGWYGFDDMFQPIGLDNSSS